MWHQVHGKPLPPPKEVAKAFGYTTMGLHWALFRFRRDGMADVRYRNKYRPRISVAALRPA